MQIEKDGRKWVIKGEGKGWILEKSFPTKWKAEVALKVFSEGGKVSDYWKEAQESSPPLRYPTRAIAEVEDALDQINVLKPTAQEIIEYGKQAGYGVVTYMSHEAEFGPRLHNTWGRKSGGRVHIDIGGGRYHLMLDKYWAKDFIRFIKTKRESPGN